MWWAEREGTAGQERKITCFTLDNILDSMMEFCKGFSDILVLANSGSDTCVLFLRVPIVFLQQDSWILQICQSCPEKIDSSSQDHRDRRERYGVVG